MRGCFIDFVSDLRKRIVPHVKEFERSSRNFSLVLSFSLFAIELSLKREVHVVAKRKYSARPL